MKPRVPVFAFAILLTASLPAAAQNLGDRCYKEVTVDGETLYKWVDYAGFTEYDINGKEIHGKSSGGYECWFEYDFYADGKVKTCRTYKRFQKPDAANVFSAGWNVSEVEKIIASNRELIGMD